MKRLLAAAALAGAVLGWTVAPAQASKKSPRKKKPQLEVYSATEGPDGDSVPDTVVIFRAGSGNKAKAKTGPNVTETVGTGAKIAKGTFDIVPAQQAEAISRRLELVDRLIREFGRAYDYRIHTIAELEKILSDLESAAQKTGDLPPPPPEAPVES